MTVAVFGSLFNTIDQALTQNISQTAANVGGALAPAIQVSAVLYIVFKGYTLMSGRHHEIMGSVVWNVVRLVLIVTLGTNVGVYDQYVTQFLFVGVPVQLSNALTGQTASNAAGLMDTILNAGIAQSQAIWSQASVMNVASSIWGAMPAIGGALCSAIGEVMILTARIALSLILSLGPLFIAFGLFEATRTWFRAWLNTALDYILLQILTVALAIMLVNTARFVGTGAASASGAVAAAATGAEAAFSIIAIYFVGFFLFLRLPMISAALSSGAGLYGVAFGGGQAKALGGAVSGATAPARAIGRAIGNFGQKSTTISRAQT